MTRPRSAPIKSARAIMAGRKEKPSSRDDFFTPPWGTRALVEVVLAQNVGWDSGWSIWEPACGEGHMAGVLAEYFTDVYPTDIHDYGYTSMITRDFLDRRWPHECDWIITNPPFLGGQQDRALEFTLRALELARFGVAMFVRTQWATEGCERYKRLPSATIFAPFSERVPLCKGRWDPDGGTATGYCWMVWLKGRNSHTEMFRIPPGQRVALTKPDDRWRFAQWMYELAPAALKIWRKPHWTEKDAFKEIAKKFSLSESSARNLVRFGHKIEQGKAWLPAPSLSQQEAAE